MKNKDIYDIKDETAYNDFKSYIKEDRPKIVKVEGNIVETEDYIFEISEDYYDLIEDLSDMLSEAPEFDISSYSVKVIENQGYEFKTF